MLQEIIVLTFIFLSLMLYSDVYGQNKIYRCVLHHVIALCLAFFLSYLIYICKN